MNPPFPTLTAKTENANIPHSVFVEIGLFDDSDIPGVPRNVPLTQYLTELSECSMARSRSDTP